MSKVSFQTGSIRKRETVKGFTWELRYRSEGRMKAITLGNDHDLPNLTAAKIKASEMLPTINKTVDVQTFGELVERYIAEEMPARPQTAASYMSAITRLKAQFGHLPLSAMLKDLMGIQTWISDLQTLRTATGIPPRPMSKKTKQNIKAMLHRLIECAMRWGFLPVDRNPVGLVEIKVRGIQPKKRLKVPLTIKQINDLVNDDKLPDHVRLMIYLCLGLGLRISEVLGLKWSDIDLVNRVITIERSCVGSHIDATKSDTSRDSLPFSLVIGHQLNSFKNSNHQVINGWVFGSAVTGRPFHRDSLQSDHLAPAGARCGINGLGWHTFRHTHIAFLRQVGAAAEVQMMLMRHSDIRTTNEYGRDSGSMELKRPAQQAATTLMFESPHRE